jgi:murein DD-endopeptidase MepM/ murein hydrolase activator NlpD
MKVYKLEVRGCDSQGCGHFGASRGTRKHNGVDLVCDLDTPINSPISGMVTKIGWPYGDKDKQHIRYVQVTSGDYDFRVFYINPAVEVGQMVSTDSVLGFSQELGCFYQGITEHVHLEIKDKNECYIDPSPTLIAMRCL